MSPSFAAGPLIHDINVIEKGPKLTAASCSVISDLTMWSWNSKKAIWFKYRFNIKETKRGHCHALS